VRKIWPVPKLHYTALGDHAEPRDVILLYSRAAWEAVRPSLQLRIRSQAEVREATEEYWNTLNAALDGEVVYSVGGGLACDAAKYIAAKRGLPLVCVPTALSVDAFFTWASGIRRGGCVAYLETKPPDLTIIDFETIGRGPAELRASGICDVLSIATGCADWQYAHERGKNPPHMQYLPAAADTAQAILRGAIDAAESAGRGEAEGLARLVDALVLEVQLCNLIGHSRPEEGSEHYFAYCAENYLGAGHSHGELVGPGIILMAQRLGLDVASLEKALRACHVPLDRLSDSMVEETLRQLPRYCCEFNLSHGIAHDLDLAQT